MEIKRSRFQGVLNIIRFNWHFYILAIILITLLFIFAGFVSEEFAVFIYIFVALAGTGISISLFVSFYVYDLSNLYELSWLQHQGTADFQSVLNIHAGFDETSAIIQNRFPGASLTICDFYDPILHTEISIKRARKAYPGLPGTIRSKTNQLPFQTNSFDSAFIIFSAHEIRNAEERACFFSEMKRITTGPIFVTEHIRNLPNFLAYSLGFFHFLPRSAWLRTFRSAGLSIKKEVRTTPFVTTFILHPDGNTY